MATLESRIKALEVVDDGIEILNPRTFEIADPIEREEAERQNDARVAAAIKAGHRITQLQPLHNVGD
jgi:hypothetical protein